jgi:ATP-binding cassette subfamily B protein
VRSGRLTLGELILVMAYIAQLYEPLRTISKRLADLQSGLASAKRAFELFDELPEVVEKPDSIPVARTRGRIEFRGVAFGYSSERPVLSNIDITITPGSRVGIAGRTGSGKTTMVSLLLRLYDPQSGAILLDGRDLREYRLQDLRNQFALVLQEPVLFSATIAENIAYGRPGATTAEVTHAATLANADEFIRALPEGYETQVGDRGMRLSGGERQRVSLARAFLKDAPVLVLDEPTSALDLQTEAKVMDAMERLMHGRTTFLITHRLSTLENCSMRLVVADGQVSCTAVDTDAVLLEDRV